MSDQRGRRSSFIVCFVIFIIANIGLALQTNYAALLVLRMVQALGCGATIALSVAVIADISTLAERGRYMGYAVAGLLFGPAFGPTIGGLLTQYLGWRAVFWFLAIYTGCLLLIFIPFFPETCRNVVGNGSIPARGVNQSVLSYLIQRRLPRQEHSIPKADNSRSLTARKSTFPNPIRTLKILGEPESCIVLLYNGLFFTGLMLISTAIPDLYKNAYALNELEIGLCYIALGTGSLVSTLSMGRVVDWNFSRHARKLNIPIVKGQQQNLENFPIEKVRLEVVIPAHIIGIVSLIVFGWTVEFRTHIAGPEVALFFIGFGISTSFNITNTLLVDLHHDKPATAIAAVNFVRCLMSAGGCAAIIPMTQAMNPGWAFTFVALVYVILVAALFYVMKNGMRWRAEAEEKKRVRDAMPSNAV
jgi:MFS family permease